MKHVIATIACAAIIILYAAIGASLGWKKSGGVLPMLLLMSAVAATWKGITGTKSSSDALSTPINQPSPVQTSPNLKPRTSSFIVFVGGEQKGPYTQNQIAQMWGSGVLTADALYWDEPSESWLKVSELVERE